MPDTRVVIRAFGFLSLLLINRKALAVTETFDIACQIADAGSPKPDQQPLADG